METGFRGTFVISWSQTEIDGLAVPPANSLVTGATWKWHGVPTRIDGSQSVLSLGRALGDSDLRRRAARTVRRLVGAALDPSTPIDEIEAFDPPVETEFTVTDGRRSYPMTLIEVAGAPLPLILFHGRIPPAETEMWVVSAQGLASTEARSETAQGVICFAAGTAIATPDGPCLVEELQPGDSILTMDDGPQEVLWCGTKRMSGARLYAMPWLRPIRVRAGALGFGEPDDDLVVSPRHRLLLRGKAAQTLFNSPEVLVRAEDLRNDHSVAVDHHLREVTYHHILLERHQVVWANGVASESFHPADAALAEIAEDQQRSLADVCPTAVESPAHYGGYARRSLSGPEAAILRHAIEREH